MNALLLALSLLAQQPALYISPILTEPILGAQSIAVRIEGPERAEFQLLERITPAGKRPSRWRQKRWQVKLTRAADGLYAIDSSYLAGTLRISEGTVLFKLGNGNREIKLARMRLADRPVRLEAEREP